MLPAKTVLSFVEFVEAYPELEQQYELLLKLGKCKRKDEILNSIFEKYQKFIINGGG